MKDSPFLTRSLEASWEIFRRDTIDAMPPDKRDPECVITQGFLVVARAAFIVAAMATARMIIEKRIPPDVLRSELAAFTKELRDDADRRH